MSTEADGRKVTGTAGARSRIAEVSLGIGVLNCVVMAAGTISSAAFADESPFRVVESSLRLYLLSPAATVVGFALGLFALLRALFQPHRYGGRMTAIAGIGASVLSLVIANVFVATERVFNQGFPGESSALSDVRTMISAQAAYQSTSGYFGTPECLVAPTRCLPDYPHAHPTFLDSALASEAPKRHYVRRFHPGPPASAPPGTASPPPGSLQSFAYTAVPANSEHTRMRRFCVDSTWRTCFTKGSAPLVKDGLCDPGCQDLP